MSLVFDWDRHNRSHIARHRITCEEAEQVVGNDPIDLTVQTEDGEERIAQVGHTNQGRLLVVVITWRRNKVRVVTAFPAPKQLQKLYLESR